LLFFDNSENELLNKCNFDPIAQSTKSDITEDDVGPSPAPLLPRWDLFVWDGVLKDIGTTILPCNWLQCMENSLDPVHLEWLHVYWGNYQLKDAGFDRELPTTVHTKIKFDQFEHGIIKRRTYTNTTEDDPEWTIGHPIIFPNWLRVGTGFQMRVPIDDTHTMHVHYNVYAPPKGVEAPKQDSIPHYEVPLRDEEGKFPVDFTIGQDQMAWVTQGAIAKRELEKLGESDRGIILYRKMLVDEMDKVANGMEPLNVFRDPSKNQIIELFQEHDPAIRMTPPREPLPGMIDPITGDISAAPTGRHAPVGLKARSIYKKPRLIKGFLSSLSFVSQNSVAFVRVENAFAHSDVFWCNFDKLVFIDKAKRFFQAELNCRC